MEKSVIEAVEKGFMTKDLAIIVHGTTNLKRDQYCETIEFIKKVRAIYEKNQERAKL